ncbi:MAG: hypothetical protein HWN81_04985 [Candidatus Lokiarchaeota archaeon]|nr:hypothetical protein [Candidatus Lokiarchaeota archaeon]
MNKQNKTLISILMICFMVFAIIPSFLITPSAIQTTINFDTVDNQEPEPKTSQFIPRTIRVAIYNEPNISVPVYAQAGTPSLNNNYTGLLQLLQGAGYQVDELTCDDIYNHKLMTADYDVFVMVDNLPKVNITDYVKEFWLGGGALLSFDSAIAYLCYYGILMSESVGDEGRHTYYDYTALKPNNISSRHPTTQDYQVNDKYSCVFTNAFLYWDYLLTTSVGGMVTKLANTDGNNNMATAVALERTDQGGRIVLLPGRTNVIGTNMSNLIIDAVDWLCPRPKGRILFDLSHLNGYGVDLWDNPFVDFPDNRFTLMRNNLVNRSYTFDKLYPSALGNLTTSNLAPYDLLIINLPDTNFTASEVTSVTNWINNGGGLLALGDNPLVPSVWDRSKNLNYLLSSFDLSLIYDFGTNFLTTSFEHPTEEGCSSLTMAGCSLLNYTGNAYPLWGNSPTDICIAGEEYGNGRVILTSDINLFDNSRIGLTDNLQYSINVVNWLTATNAEVLIYIEQPNVADPNDNEYRGPVATALNDLNIPFHLTFDIEYFNLSLSTGDFKLAIIDHSRINIESYFGDILDFMKSGGFLILSTSQYYYGSGDGLWDYLGFYYAGDTFNTPPDLYIWDITHPIFNLPANYGTNTINTTLNFVSVDMVNTSLHNNATAIAGLTSTSSNDGAAIILGAGGRAITNTMLLSTYYEDTDNSTYPDAVEIWENEIAFMTYQSLSVNINNPHTDDLFDATAPSFSITTDGIIIDEIYYTLNDGTHHPITSTSGTINQGSWDALPDDSVSLKFYVEDPAGSSKYAAVIIEKDTQAPIINIISPTSGQTFSSTAPDFNISITDDHLDKMWYTVDAGLTNFTFNANGAINQTAWDVLSQGTITLRFYANDTLGHISSEDVSITKDLPSKVIGLDYFMTGFLITLIGGVAIITIITKIHSKKRIVSY